MSGIFLGRTERASPGASAAELRKEREDLEGAGTAVEAGTVVAVGEGIAVAAVAVADRGLRSDL